MPYLIRDIRSTDPVNGYRYLFDCNTWLAVLEDSYNSKTYQPYINFFNSIITEKNGAKAEIVLPGLLLSEILNRLIHDIYFEEFVKSNPTRVSGNKRKDFKDVYRNDPQYAIDIENACADIRAYHKKVSFISDRLEDFTFKDLIKKIPVHLDINDHIFAKMAAAQGLVIVTHDGDFKVEDVVILTSNPALLPLST